jgi:hypothetical protein
VLGAYAAAPLLLRPLRARIKVPFAPSPSLNFLSPVVRLFLFLFPLFSLFFLASMFLAGSAYFSFYFGKIYGRSTYLCYGFAYVLCRSESVGLCLLSFAVILICFNSSPTAFLIEATLSFFISGSPWISIVCCVGSLPQDLRTMLFYSLAPLSSAYLGCQRWSSSTESSSSSSLLAFSALAPSIIMGLFGHWGLWWASPVSFPAMTMVFCNLPMDSFGPCFCGAWRYSCVSGHLGLVCNWHLFWGLYVKLPLL